MNLNVQVGLRAQIKTLKEKLFLQKRNVASLNQMIDQLYIDIEERDIRLRYMLTLNKNKSTNFLYENLS